MGSEGTLGVATKLVLRIVKQPVRCRCCSPRWTRSAQRGRQCGVIAAGMLPAAMEIMDRLSRKASEAAVHPNYPVCEALLLIELDGAAGVADGGGAGLCEKNGAWNSPGARAAERALILKGRKAAFAAMGHIGRSLHRAGRRDSAYGAAGEDRQDGG